MMWLVKGVAVGVASYLAIRAIEKRLHAAELDLIQKTLKAPFLEGDK